MEEPTFELLYCDILKQNGLDLYCKEPYIGKFEHFFHLFLQENEVTNLSAIRSPAEAIAKHIADCLLAVDCLPSGATVLDVGCGGGFPTIPWAIARPDLHMTAMDSTQKKIDCVARIVASLGLQNVKPVCGRAEDAKQKPLFASFDVVTARAVANLRVLAELTLSFVRVGGLLVALKGAQGSEEAKDAENALKILGGELESDLSRTLICPVPQKEQENGDLVAEYVAESRHILLIRKQKPTPSGYPRVYAHILKRPL